MTTSEAGGTAKGGTPGADLLEAAVEAIDAARAVGTRMRLLGGVAVLHLASSARRAPLARSYHDYDVVVSAKEGSSAAKVFRSLGYGEDRHFNALHGAQRLIFSSGRGFDVDVLVGTFQMCHRLDLGADLPEAGITVHPADLLLTKVQIVQIEQKDLCDSVALLRDIPVGATADEGISTERFARPLSADWGFYHTVELNLEKVGAYADVTLTSEEARTVRKAIGELRAAMTDMPKSVKWKVRSKVGERVPWYELPEEV